MPNTEFSCIDDQQDTSIEQLLQLLAKQDSSLSITRHTPIELGTQIEQIAKLAKASESFGLLLDLRLDMEADKNGGKVPYRGPTLAQELRTRMAEGEIRPFPIILWSINEKFLKSFFGDDTSHDLFDAVYGKDEAVIKQPEVVCAQMISLAQGYREIETTNQAGQLNHAILHLNEDELDGVNATFLATFQETINRSAEHEVSLHLLSDLIKPTGLLVDEATVAARLGIDRENSGKHWDKLLECINDSKYLGPFRDGWPRWWWFRIENWWNNLGKRMPNIRRLGASERIAILNETLGLILKPAVPIQSNYSDKYFVVCFATGKPLDPIDGLRIATPHMKPWHDVTYISTYAALNRVAKEKWQIDPYDRDRLDEIKNSEK